MLYINALKLILSAILIPQALSVPVANPQDPPQDLSQNDESNNNNNNKPKPILKPNLPSVPDLPGVDPPNLPSIPEEVLDVLDFVPDPRDIPIIEFLSNDLYKCGWHFYKPDKVAEAVRWGMFYKRVGVLLGFRRYPHRFFNKEGFNFPVQGPYYEFPILRIGKIFTGDNPLEDRVIFTEGGDLAGLVTHVGRTVEIVNGREVERENGFEKCTRVPSVLEKAKDIVTKPFRGGEEGGEEEGKEGEGEGGGEDEDEEGGAQQEQEQEQEQEQGGGVIEGGDGDTNTDVNTDDGGDSSSIVDLNGDGADSK